MSGNYSIAGCKAVDNNLKIIIPTLTFSFNMPKLKTISLTLAKKNIALFPWPYLAESLKSFVSINKLNK